MYICGLYYKHVMIVNDDSSIISKWSIKFIDDPSVVIHNRHKFIIQAADGIHSSWSKGFIRDKLETLDPMQYMHALACDVTGPCMHILHGLPHDITGQCMQLLHGLCCFDFVSDIHILQLLWIEFGHHWSVYFMSVVWIINNSGPVEIQGEMLH